ncbi:MAG: hypothetical protein DBX59_08660 [Bacillota bacterium]|nr:MAG: hypothetical protein DBX59_08660 [Bacillota bacterium]
MKKIISMLLSVAIACTAAVAVPFGGCANKPKYRMEYEKGATTVEAGEYYAVPVPAVYDAADKEVTEDVIVVPTVLDPDGEEAYIDASDYVKIEKVGKYTVTLEILDEDIRETYEVTGVDTQAPVITGAQNYKSDVFKGETVTLPKLITEDATGVDTSKTRFEVFEGDSDVPMEITDGRWAANSLDGYTIKCYVEDKAGNNAARELKIRVTEKWLDAAHLNGRELATFGNDSYLSNVKGFGEKPSCEFELTNDVPAANTDDGYGSADGKALKVTLKEGAKRERCWFRVWLPRPFTRSEIGSIVCKVWTNATVDKLWIYNNDLHSGDAESGWDASSDGRRTPLVYDKWCVLEVPQSRFWEDVYGEKQIEYLDFAVFYSGGSEEDPVLYLDEIFYDELGTSFVDADPAKQANGAKTVADFDEVNDCADGLGNPVGGRKYEDTVKIRGNIKTVGCVRVIRSFVDATDPALPQNAKKASGKVLKLQNLKTSTSFFLLFPTQTAYDAKATMSMNIFVGDTPCDILLHGYAEKSPECVIRAEQLQTGKWNTVRFPMSIFSKDVSSESPDLKGMYIGMENYSSTLYIDNICVTAEALVPAENIAIIDFSEPLSTGSIVNIEGTQTTETIVSGSEVPEGFIGGALKCVTRAEDQNKGGFYLYFDEGISRKDIAKLSVKLKLTSAANFMQVAAVLSPKGETPILGNNATCKEMPGDVWQNYKVNANYTFEMAKNDCFQWEEKDVGMHHAETIYGVFVKVNYTNAACTYFVDFVAYSPAGSEVTEGMVEWDWFKNPSSSENA